INTSYKDRWRAVHPADAATRWNPQYGAWTSRRESRRATTDHRRSHRSSNYGLVALRVELPTSRKLAVQSELRYRRRAIVASTVLWGSAGSLSRRFRADSRSEGRLDGEGASGSGGG